MATVLRERVVLMPDTSVGIICVGNVDDAHVIKGFFVGREQSAASGASNAMNVAMFGAAQAAGAVAQACASSLSGRAPSFKFGMGFVGRYSGPNLFTQARIRPVNFGVHSASSVPAFTAINPHTASVTPGANSVMCIVGIF